MQFSIEDEAWTTIGFASCTARALLITAFDSLSTQAHLALEFAQERTRKSSSEQLRISHLFFGLGTI